MMNSQINANQKIKTVITNFEIELKTILEEVANLDPIVKENQIAGFTSATAKKIFDYSQSKAIDEEEIEKFYALIDRMDDTNNIALRVETLFDKCRQDILDIDNN